MLIGTYSLSFIQDADLWNHVKDTVLKYKMGKQTKIAQNFCLFPEMEQAKISLWQQEMQTKPLRAYRSIELFAGAGGLALGLEKAGFHNVLLNEIDKYAAASLRLNRSAWHVVEQDIHQIDFSPYHAAIQTNWQCRTRSFCRRCGQKFNSTFKSFNLKHFNIC